MKFKKIMLVTFVLLAILTLGAVSAADDADNLTATEDVGDVDIIEAPQEANEILSDGNGTSMVIVDDINKTGGNDDVEIEDDECDDGEEDSFELWIDEDSEGFDVSSPDLSGYFIGSVTVPENVSGNISIITENDDILFNKALNDFDSNLIRDNNIYDVTLSDDGRYIFEGVDDGTLFIFAFLDEEGIEIWESSNYKLVIDEDTIWLKEADGDEEGGDDEFDPTKFRIDRRDDENNILALNIPVFSLYCPDGSEGTVEVTVSYNGNDYSVSKNISDMDENNFIHWYLNDLNMTFLVKYEITVDVNDGEFESHFDAYVHDPIFFFAEKSYINTLDDGSESFVCFEAPSEYTNATVIIEVDDMIFNKTLSEFEYADDTNDYYYWFHPSYGPGPGDERYKHYMVYNGVFNSLEAKTYNVTATFILVNSPVGNRTFIKSGTIDVLDGGMVENNGVAMEVGHQEEFGVGNEYEFLVTISVPDGANGKVTVSLDGRVIFESDLDHIEDEDGYFVRPSNLELDEGEYDLTFAYFEDDEKIVETNGTFIFIRYGDEGDDEGNDADDGVVIWVDEGDVKEFDLSNDDDLNCTFAYVSVSNDLNGNITVSIYMDEDEPVEIVFFNKDLSEITNKEEDFDNEGFTIYNIALSDLGGFDAFLEYGYFEIAFISEDEEGEFNNIDCRGYNIEIDEDNDNIIRFWQAGDEDDESPIFFNDAEIYTDPESPDYREDEWIVKIYFDEPTAGRFVLSNNLITLFDINLPGDNENGDWLVEGEDGASYYEVHLNELNLTGLTDGDWLEFIFYNEGDDEPRYTKHVDVEVAEDYFRFNGENGWEDDGPIEDVEFYPPDSGDKFEIGDNVEVAYLYIPDYMNDLETNMYVFYGDELIYSKNTADIEAEHDDEKQARKYPIALNLTQLEDKTLISFTFDYFGDDVFWAEAVQVDGDKIIFWDDPDFERLEFYSFYGNLTTGTLNNPELMGPNMNGMVMSITISDYYNITDGTFTISDGEKVLFTKKLSEIDDKEYDYSSLGYVYIINSAHFDLMTLPENNVTFTFTSGNISITQKRLRIDDYLYKVLTPDDFSMLSFSSYEFEIAEDPILVKDDDAIVIYGNSNMQSIYIDFGGGIFIVYVNDTKVEGLGYLLYEAWKNSDVYVEEYDYPSDWGSDLSLARLRGGSVSLNEFHISLADLGITTSGTYNIRITHYPDVDGMEEEYIYVAETELANKNIIVDFGDLVKNSTIEISGIEFDYNKSGSADVTLVGAGDIIAYVVDHDEANVTFVNGKITVSGLDAGEYKLNITTVPDEGFTAANKLVNITVNKIDADLAVVTADIYTGETETITIRLFGYGTVKVMVDGIAYTVTVVDGVGYLNVTNLNAGTYMVNAIFEGDNNIYSAQINKSFTVTYKPDGNVTKDTFRYYFDESGVLTSDLNELVFVGDFTGLDINALTINKAVNITGHDAVFANVLFNIVGDDVSISNLNINNNGTDYAITVTGSGVSLIANSINAVNSVLISDCANFTVDSNTIVTTAGDDVCSIYITGTASGVVRNNKLDLKSEKTAYAINTKPTGPFKVSYINNTIDAESYFAVGIYDDSELIKDNKISLSGNYAIGIVVLSEASVEGNVITLDTTNTGSDDTVQDDIGVETAGIKVSGDATITNNNVESTAKSISVVGGSSKISENTLIGQVKVESDGNTISDNVISTTEEYAVDLGTSTGNTIDKNELYSSEGNGNQAVKADEGNTITNNYEKVDPALKIEVANIEEGSAAIVKITTNATFTGKVLVQVGEGNYTVDVVNGSGSTPVTGLVANTYTAVATFEATGAFNASTAQTTFTVTAKPAPETTPQVPSTPTTPVKADTIKLTLKKVTVKKSAKKLVVQATLKVNGKAVNKKVIKFKFNGKTYKAKTNKNGIAKITVKKAVLKKLKVGKKVTYTATYGKTTVKKSVKVKK